MTAKEVNAVLEEVAIVNNITNYAVYPDKDILKGDGFLGEFYTGCVKNLDNGEIIQTYIKKIPEKQQHVIAKEAFFNEAIFYSNIWPELDKFQIKKGIKNPFTNIPKMYCCKNEPGNKYIAMENLNAKNFGMVDKSKYVSCDIIEEVFQRYGQFHALTFSYKNENLKKYTELVTSIKDLYVVLGSMESHMEFMHSAFIAAYNGLKDRDDKAAKQIKHHVDNMKKDYYDIVSYNGKFSGLVHGDCWSNNLLFKFKEDGKVEDIKFLDFQLCRDTTPIHDLSYFFYSAGSKEDFKKVDTYLELYHKSFSDFSTKLGHNPKKLYPFKTLKAEWKKYSKLGIILGIMLWHIKLLNKESIDEIVSGGNEEVIKENSNVILSSEIFKTNTSEILLHALEYGLL